MVDGIVMILFAFILFLVAVFVWAYKDKQYVESEIEWSTETQKLLMVLGELGERHYNVMECIDNQIKSADELREPINELDFDELGYWNGAYDVLVELKKEIDEKNDKFHIKIEKITKEM